MRTDHLGPILGPMHDVWHILANVANFLCGEHNDATSGCLLFPLQPTSVGVTAVPPPPHHLVT